METDTLLLICLIVVIAGLTIWRGKGRQPDGSDSFFGQSINLADINRVGEANTKAVEENTVAIRDLIAKLDERKG